MFQHAGNFTCRTEAPRTRCQRHGSRRGPGGARPRCRGAPVRSSKGPAIPVRKAVLGLAPYNPPEEGRAAKLRLDFNENTAGCSPAVLRALSRMTAEEIAIYPEYQATTKRLARFFRVSPQEMHLTNGIDDALHLISDTFI